MVVSARWTDMSNRQGIEICVSERTACQTLKQMRYKRKTGNWSSHLGRNGCPLNRHTGVFIAELEVSDPTFTVSVFCKHRLQIDEPQSQWDVQCNYSKCDCCSSLVCTIQKTTFLLQTALHPCNESNNTNMIVHKWTQHTYVPSPRISGSNVLLHAGVCTELSEGIITF